ncbi:DUF255 domain-containing protein [Halanaeroarchaeum sulfurireducens]|uniref:Thymidylate kinase n=1 Tax=Halanaeroarchaeum sulfurireducens TaxID=1604004 RepID=A0A0F7PB64_9EURY|nr:DUF255 domain-containing protein [Halanaeroarchaeum sulfurireducens]AKH98401.1 thymidylate kinase [Halanaeroarchaeum sulfurireducens]ALG82795.1 thymidylate kinase [Halanaeroarchaeum sulfurireducens]
MDDAADAMKVEWREWGQAAFDRAQETDQPILLSITAKWCGWCQTMDATTYARPRIAAIANHDFVPIRVDADRHPRVRDRYNAGGFPSTVVLTPSGRLVAAGSYLDPEQMGDLLERSLEEWRSTGEEAGQVPPSLKNREPPSGSLTEDVERFINGQVEAQFDEEHAGWGTEEKFPMPDTIEFALKRQPERAKRTLDALRAALFDDHDGGFFRHAGDPDWSNPTREKLLDVNAGLLRAFANGYLTTGDDTYRRTASRTVDYLVQTLWTGDGFGNSQQPGEYFERPTDERSTAEAPPIDETCYAGPNAMAAAALTRYAAYTDDETARRYASETLSFLETSLLDGGVVSHCATGCESGILTGQAAALRAYVTASQVLDPAYVETARAIADATIERLQTEGGAFRDGPEAGPGLLDTALYPIDDNARLANALVDLHVMTDEDSYHGAAVGAIEAFAGAAERMGPQVAGYGTAAARVLRHPLVIAVGTDPGEDLHRAALRMADHEKVVIPDSSAIEPGHAALLTAEGAMGDAQDPPSLADLVAEYELAE